MLIAKTLLMAVLLLASFALEERRYSRLSRTLRLTDDDDDDDDRSREAKERQNDPEYFEQCYFVNVWKEQLGYVSVLAFLDPTWQYSFRQAVMLRLLSARLRKSGFPNIRFFVIAPPPDLTEDKIENELEIQAWQEISMLEPENLTSAKHRFLKDGESEMIFVQDGPQSRMWERFRASKDQVVVIDRCGKLTYQVMVPWSILYFPYVKAAILSTYREDPCGACDPDLYRALDYEEYFLNLINGTGELTDLRKNADARADSIRTAQLTSSVAARFNESSEETGAASVTPVDEITDGTVRLHLSNVTGSSAVTESAGHQYDDTIGSSSLGEDRPSIEEKTRKQGDSTEPEGSTVLDPSGTSSGETTVSRGSQMPSKQEEAAYARGSTSDSAGASREDARDRTLLDEPAKDEVTDDPIPPIPETTSDLTMRERGVEGEGGSGIADIGTEGLAKYGQNDSIGGESALEASKRSEKSVPGASSEWSSLPLRIIMHAPHTHRNGKDVKKHTHLILRMDSPDFHGHLDSEGDLVASTDTQQSSDHQTTNSEKYEWEEIEADADRGSTNKEYTFDKDESPGLYGEVADYWRSFEDSDITDRNETANYNSTDIAELDETNSSKDHADVKDQLNKEDEMRNKLIEHYNKLLPWIYYILNR